MTGSSNTGEDRQTDRLTEQMGKSLKPHTAILPTLRHKRARLLAGLLQPCHHASQQAAVSSAADGLSVGGVGRWGHLIY